MQRHLTAALGLVLVLGACDATEPGTTITTAAPPTRPPATSSTAASPPATAPAPTMPPATTTLPAPVTTTTAPPPPASCPALATAALDQQSGSVLHLFRDGGAELWAAPLGERRIAAARLAGGVAYVGLDDGTVAALDTATCETRWQRQLSGPVQALVVTGERIAVADAAGLRVLDVDGADLWQVPLETRLGPIPIAGGALVVADVGGDRLLVLEPDGTVAWQAPLPTGELIGLAAGVDVVFAVSESSVVARELATGERRWTMPVDVAGLIAPTVEGGTLYLAGTGVLYAIDAGDGSQRWRQEMAHDGAAVTFLGPPRLDHNEVHILDSAGRLHHLRRRDGASLFTTTYPAGRTTEAFADRLVLIATDGVLRAENLLGAARWEIATGADGITRGTTVDVAGDLILAHTFPLGGG